MKYLITGGTGFIGSRVTRDLVREGELVVVYDCAPERTILERLLTKNEIEIPHLLLVTTWGKTRPKEVLVECPVCKKEMLRNYQRVTQSIKRGKYTGKCKECSYSTRYRKHRKYRPDARGYLWSYIGKDSPY